MLHGVDLADLLEEVVGQAIVAVEGGSTYPLFDDHTGDFVGEAVCHGLVVPTDMGVARGRHSGLSSDLLRRLPLFEWASLSDVLGIRRELEGLLQGFRLAVSSFSCEISSAAWELGFSEEADALFRERVKPEVERIEEAVRENNSLGSSLGGLHATGARQRPSELYSEALRTSIADCTAIGPGILLFRIVRLSAFAG